ncbi:hypothetical protein [Marinobacterium rhizophilum]|uniref:DUF5666 domain-containing protein n=1 Tax=Marinobacterium rhizophilum TaxID=420402 RepID=A0ABY5HN47_9GAMM|nr:hypothetical protein [Marinobacterium rhizophilum]UTW12677.1 hypothetical protein KDW95_03060 [Marinobacterium rhizophilum]
MTAKKLLGLLALGVLAVLFFPEGERTQSDGVLVEQAPRQAAVSRPPFDHEGYRIDALAEFDIDARVLGKERYWLDRESDLSKYDLALGWGPMSDSRVLDRIDIRQSGRWYRWRAEQLPIARQQIEQSSANMHLVPADDYIERQIAGLRTGDLVRISGYLIKATAADGWRWRSSLTREDVGQGACELVYVEAIEIL